MPTWTGRGDAVSWQDAENWEPKAVPAPGGETLIPATVAPVRIYSNSEITLATLQLSRCLLEAPSVSVSERMLWEGGDIAAGSFTCSGVLTISESAQKQLLKGCAFEAVGSTRVVGDAGRVYVANGASWTSAGPLQCSGKFAVIYGGDTMTKFVSQGHLDVTGTLDFQGVHLIIEGSCHTGAPEGILRITKGRAELASTTRFTGDGTLVIGGGPTAWPDVTASQLLIPSGMTFAMDSGDLTGSMHIDGTMEWSGGHLSGSLKIGPSGRLQPHSTSQLRLGEAQLDNEGAVEFRDPGTVIWLDDRVAIRNTGRLSIEAETRLGTSGIGQGVLANHGHMIIAPDVALILLGQIDLENNGIIDIGAGGSVKRGQTVILGPGHHE